MDNGEKIQNALSGIDADLLREAYAVDDAQKLKRQAKKPFYRTGVFRGAVAAAACLAVAVSIWQWHGRDIPTELPPTPNLNISAAPYWATDATVTVDSLDALNYYAAASVLRGANLLGAADDAPMLSLLAETDTPETSAGFDTPPITSEGRPSENTPTESIPEDMISYELDPDGTYTITEVSYLQIRLTDEDGFLASKVGVGNVDVMITQISFFGNPPEGIITFRNGDRFYSCCENSGGIRENGESYRQFSTHKYVQGNYLIKNLSQENYAFEITYDLLGNAVSIVCSPFKAGGDRADSDISVVYSIARIEVDVTLTISQLEDFFRAENLPKNDDDIDLPPTPEEAALADVYLCEDGSFFDLSASGIFAFHEAGASEIDYRKGQFSLDDAQTLRLCFYEDGQAVDEELCGRTEDGFLYRGREYVRQGTRSVSV